ncbi:MAG: CusA/CzcA family heavy metal efflux RND transporter [Bacteroidetes bacterium]|nr:CusA/CzcA family heavy metal efflux RND transporter [Bacteroidota bacterium]MCL6102832.1 CusA/CzcA family heavy metal efflux RND transporter [Bacteroidota bacterium]
MLNHIISFSIKNKLIIGLFTIILIGWGIYSLGTIPINAVPDITNNQVQIITTSENLAALEVEQLITYPVELAMNNLPGVQEIRSISRFGLSVVTVVFKENMGTYLPRQLVAEKLTKAKENTGDLGTPEMAPISTGLGEIYQYTLEVKPGYESRYTPTDLRTVQEWLVSRQLSGIEGVVEINTAGGYLKQYEIAVDPNKLNSYNITLSDIFTALENNNQNTGGSYIEHGPEMYYIRSKGFLGSLNDIRQIVVANRKGIPITIGDIADVGFGHAPRLGAATENGRGETVIGVVMMLKGANSTQVIERVKQRVAEIQKTLPEGLALKPFLDRTKLIKKTTGTVEENLILGGLIVIFVLVFLLGNIRSGFIVASVIPLSMLFALGMMKSLGVSANLMSLGAMDFGIIVDGAVIIVEFMAVQLVRNNKKLQALTGNAKQDEIDRIAKESSSKMMNAAIFGQIIILIVFLPILSLQGVEGKMFKPMALTFAFALLGAMLLCITYVPMMASAILHEKEKEKKPFGEKLMDWLNKTYAPVIRYALRKKWVVISVAVILLGSSIIAFLQMGGEFIPRLEEGDFAVEFHMAPGTSVTETVKNSEKMERILLAKFPEVEQVVSRIGAAEVPTDPDPVEGGFFVIALKPMEDWKTDKSYEELADEMKDALSVLPGISMEFSQPIEMRFNELLSGSKSGLAIKIFGDDLDTLQRFGNRVADIVRDIDGAGDVRAEQLLGLPQLVVHFKRNRLAQYGLSVNDINKLISTAYAGSTAGRFYEGEKRFDIVLRLKKSARGNVESLKNLYVPLPNGSKVPLKEMADISFENGPNQISRDDTHRRIVIGVNVRNRDIQSLVNEIKLKLDRKIKLPPGYYITYGGQFENLQRATKRLGIVIPVALALIFIILFISLKSFKQSLLIYTAIPFAAVGGVFALLVRGMPFSISAGIGFVALFGVAVLNGLVLITSLNDLKKEGVLSLDIRIFKATHSRLRPIFLTALVDILGFLPMAVSTSAGAEVQRPLATVVIGGLITSTILTLVVLPVLYALSEKISPWKLKKVSGTGILLLFFFFPVNGKAQSNISAQQISLNNCIELAIKNNPGLNIAELSIEQQHELKKTALDIGKTNIYYGQDEVNRGLQSSISTFGVSQDFEFPTNYLNKVKIQNQKIQLAQLNKVVTCKELIMQVSFAYFGWALAYRQMEIYSFLDSLYGRFYEAAELRYKTGEASNLEKLAAKNRQQQVVVLLNQARTNASSMKSGLQRWLNVTINDSISPAQFKITGSFLLPSADSLFNSPSIQYQQALVELSKMELSQQRSQLLPDISAKYGWQTIDNKKGFYTWQIGVNIPLWFKPEQGRIKSARIETKIQKQRLGDQKLELKSFYEKLSYKYSQLINQLGYYEHEGLPLSNQMLSGAELSYKTGAIGYFEYLQNIDQAVEIKTSWLQTLSDYNQTIIEINYLTGKN